MLSSALILLYHGNLKLTYVIAAVDSRSLTRLAFLSDEKQNADCHVSENHKA